MKSKRTALLKKIFADRDLAADAKELSIDLVLLGGLVGKENDTIGAPIPAATAVAIGKLTGADPRVILMAQMEDELLEAGFLPPTKLPDSVEKSQSSTAAQASGVTKKTGSRSPFGKRYSFKLD